LGSLDLVIPNLLMGGLGEQTGRITQQAKISSRVSISATAVRLPNAGRQFGYMEQKKGD